MVIVCTWWKVVTDFGVVDMFRAMKYDSKTYVSFRPYGANDVDVFISEEEFRKAYSNAPKFDANDNAEWTV